MPNTPTEYAYQLDRLLTKVKSSGRRNSEIFDDFADFCHCQLTELHQRFRQTLLNEDYVVSDRTKQVMERLNARYDEREMNHIVDAFKTLASASEHSYTDLIGATYMNFGYPNTDGGQFFTPISVAKLMAQLMLPEDLVKNVNDRIKAAIAGSPLASGMLLASIGIPAEFAEDWFVARILPPVIDDIEPETIYDPCCGSGVMFLAMAEQIPIWMTQLGLVQFCGQDVDQTAVTMAQINVMLYGLNGTGALGAVMRAEQRLRDGLCNNGSGQPDPLAGLKTAAKTPVYRQLQLISMEDDTHEEQT